MNPDVTNSLVKFTREATERYGLAPGLPSTVAAIVETGDTELLLCAAVVLLGAVLEASTR